MRLQKTVRGQGRSYKRYSRRLGMNTRFASDPGV